MVTQVDVTFTAHIIVTLPFPLSGKCQGKIRENHLWRFPSKVNVAGGKTNRLDRVILVTVKEYLGFLGQQSIIRWQVMCMRKPGAGLFNCAECPAGIRCFFPGALGFQENPPLTIKAFL